MICSGLIPASVCESNITGTSVGVADGSSVAVGNGVAVAVEVKNGVFGIGVEVAISVGAAQAEIINARAMMGKIIFFIFESYYDYFTKTLDKTFISKLMDSRILISDV
jgi:hypothetical protein